MDIIFEDLENEDFIEKNLIIKKDEKFLNIANDIKEEKKEINIFDIFYKPK